VTTFREFWGRSAHFGQNGGWDESRGARVFCLVNHATFRELRNGQFSPNLVTKRSSVSCRGIRKDTFENFHFRGHLPPKSDNELRSNRHFTQSRLQVTGCTVMGYCLLHVVVQGPASFRGRSTFFVRRTVAELRGVKVAQFSDFGLFSPSKTPKTYLLVTSLQPRVTSQNDYDFFHVVVESPKVAFRPRCFPATSGRRAGEWGPPNLPKFSPMANGYSHAECYTRQIRSGPKMSENAQF